MDKIIQEVSEIQKQINKYKFGPLFFNNDENTLGLLEIAAERLLIEIILFKAKRNAKEKTKELKIYAQEKSKVENTNGK